MRRSPPDRRRCTLLAAAAVTDGSDKGKRWLVALYVAVISPILRIVLHLALP